MCDDPRREILPVEIEKRILSENDRTAAHNREHFLEHNVLCVNLMGSPGAGKTAILEATAHHLPDPTRLVAITGDLATDRDGERLRRAGIRCVGITTGTACHLDAALVHRALHQIDLHGVDILVIENVGNLVCPAVYDLGQAVNVVALSITEGEDKPLKYPVMFQKADLVLLTKTDLLAYLKQLHQAEIFQSLSRVMPDPKWIMVAAPIDTGIEQWIDWLHIKRADLIAHRTPLAAAM